MVERNYDRKALQQEIRKIAREKNITILAHYYQSADIQDIADFIGDSLDLSRKAKEINNNIVFCGVKFMAETAKILNPEKKVLLPDLAAGCSLADNCPPDKFKEFIGRYPGHTVVSYINCSAEVKALSDVICTSSNAEAIVSSIPVDKPIIFAPDANLGRFVAERTGRAMVLWNGACIVHEAFSMGKLIRLMIENPGYRVIAHPEAEQHILKIADYIGSTRKMIDHVKNSGHGAFIVATEVGILHQMQKEVPGKSLIAAPSNEDNTCACSECAFMKVNTLEKLYRCLVDETPVIELEESLIKKAAIPLERMLAWSRGSTGSP